MKKVTCTEIKRSTILKQIHGIPMALGVMVMFTFFLSGFIWSGREMYNSLPTSFFLRLSAVNISVIKYDDTELVLSQKLVKNVRVPLYATAKREYYCAYPTIFPILIRQESDPFIVDKYHEEYIKETGENKRVSATESIITINIPVTEELKKCEVIYGKMYYSIRMPDGNIRQNEFIITTNTARIKALR